MLDEQGYTYLPYLPIHTEAYLLTNLRQWLELLNNYYFSEDDWQRFFTSAIANANEGIVEKALKIQEDNVQVLVRDDGTSKNITLIDKKNIHNNRLQVINQYVVGKIDGTKHDNRYDTTILVNGFPLVHVELKRHASLSARSSTSSTASIAFFINDQNHYELLQSYTCFS